MWAIREHSEIRSSSGDGPCSKGRTSARRVAVPTGDRFCEVMMIERRLNSLRAASFIEVRNDTFLLDENELPMLSLKPRGTTRVKADDRQEGFLV